MNPRRDESPDRRGNDDAHAGGLERLDALMAARACVATAESCTGGLVASALTSVAGSSAVYWGGWVTYDNSAKCALLGIPLALIQAKGAVSAEVAQAMAEGALARMGEAIGLDVAHPFSGALRIGLSTTGLAGPSGGSSAKPVGLCYIAVAAQGRKTRTEEFRAPPNGDRASYQAAFAGAALALLDRTLKEIEA